jgi:hypothetical protein
MCKRCAEIFHNLRGSPGTFWHGPSTCNKSAILPMYAGIMNMLAHATSGLSEAALAAPTAAIPALTLQPPVSCPLGCYLAELISPVLGEYLRVLVWQEQWNRRR